MKHTPLLPLATALAGLTLAPASAQVLITQYYEGSSNNKHIEIQNTGGTAADLSGYTLTVWSNANTEAWKVDGGSATNSLDLTGVTLPAGASYLVSNSSAALPAYAGTGDVTSSVTFFNGDDSVVLYNGTVGTVADIVDAVAFTDSGNEGSNTSFYRLTNGTGFDTTGGSTVLDYPTVWGTKTNAEVDSALASDDWYLNSLGTVGTLSISFDNPSVSESGGFGVATATITRSGSTVGDLTVTISGNDTTEADADGTEVIIFDGDADETIGINAIDDLWPDGDQTVTFTVSAPGFDDVTADLTVTDDPGDTFGLVINEVYYGLDANLTDANLDGQTSTGTPYADEFIELVNSTASPIDLTDYSMEDNFGNIHSFPAGTVLPAGAAVVVFGGGDIVDGHTSNFGTALVQKSSNGGLFLNDDGSDFVRLFNASLEEVHAADLPDKTGSIVDSSMTLATDGDASTPYLLHVNSTGGGAYSPGTTNGGTAFFTITDSLTVTVNTASALENAGTLTAALTVSIPAMLGSNLEVTLVSSDETELIPDSPVTILAGSTSVDVDVFAIDDPFPNDGVLDDDILVTVTAAAPAHLSDTGDITIQDDGDVLAPVANLVITEIMYNPASDESFPGVAEWVEIYNAGAGSVDLAGYKLDDEDSFDWGTLSGTLDPGGIAVVYDADFTDEATFRSEWGVPAGALVIGTTWGGLSNGPSASNEVLVLLDNLGRLVDEANFDDSGDWPSDNGTSSIALLSTALDKASNDVGTNWFLSGAESSNPTGPTFSATDVGSPGEIIDTTDAYDSWAGLAGLTPGVNDGPEDDAENGGIGDGIANVLEFILGGDPLASDLSILPDGSVDATDFIFTFNRADDSEDITTQTFQWATDLSFPMANDVAIGAGNSGPDGNGVTVTVTENGAGPDLIEVRVPRSNAVDGTIQGRLEATRP